MSMNTPIGSITQTTAIKDFIELENIDTQQYLLGINNIATGDGSKIKLEKILEDSISTDTGNTLEIGSDNKLLNIEEDTGVQAGNYTYPQNLVVNSKGRITSVTSGSPASVPIATTLQAGIVKPDGNTITVTDDGTINANILGYEVGDIIIRDTPTKDAGKHLLDGALIQYGSYRELVDHIADLYNNTPLEDVYNVNIVGSLTNDNGVLSGFSASNYAVIPEIFNPSSNTWEFNQPIKFDSMSRIQTFFGTTTDQTGFAMNCETSGIISLYMGNSGWNWNIANGATSTLTLSVDTWYDVKISFTGTQYLVDVSADNGTTWTNYITVNSSALISASERRLGNYAGNAYFVLGSIDLNGCYINIDGQRWWSGKTKKRARFLTEDEWQQTVATYGFCGKYVYDSVNNTVRLPKYGNQLNTKLDSTAQTTYNGSPFTMQIGINNNNRACFYSTCGTYGYGMDRANRGTGTVWTQASGDYEDVGQQSILADLASASALVDVYYYIVVANSAKTAVQVNIDEIATDLNGKADVDLTNVNDSGTSRGASWAMPSGTYIDLTLGASGTTYTAPANGWILFVRLSGGNNQYINGGVIGSDISYTCWIPTYPNGGAISFPVQKNNKFFIAYNASGAVDRFRFIYAQGSESEAN